MRLSESLIRSNTVLAVVTVVVFCLGFALGTALVHGFELHGAEVEGHSMDPTMEDGSYLLVSNATSVDRCDIVIFWSPYMDSYIGHRTVEIDNGHYITKGDNNTHIDQRVGYDKVSEDALKGEVIVKVNLQDKTIDVPYLFRSEQGRECVRSNPV